MKVYHFENLLNVRDLGGTKTKDGHCIVMDKLFRGTALGYASKNDAKILNNKIDTVVDFRTFSEVEELSYPKNLFPNAKYNHVPVIKNMQMMLAKDEKSKSLTMKQAMNLTKEDAKELMKQFYIYIAHNEESQSAYRTFIEILADDNTQSTYWHCSYGKDRAGMATALILYILGVEENIIKEDYLSSSAYLIPNIEKSLIQVKEKIGYALDIDAFTFMQTTDIDYINGLIAYILGRYGSVDYYIRDALKINNETINKLKDKYLTTC